MIKTVTIVRKTRLESLDRICALFNLKRDAYYKYVKRFTVRKTQEKKVIQMVDLKRKRQPRVGCRKLLVHLQSEFVKNDLKIGRDRLFNILRKNNRLIKPKRSSCRTTNSYHHFYKYNNLIKDFCLLEINQLKCATILSITPNFKI